MKSVTQYDFGTQPDAQTSRTAFRQNFGTKTTLNAGYLVPWFQEIVHPGDTLNLSTSIFGRLTTMLHPIMDNLIFSTFFFAVPLRLIWKNFPKFMGEKDNPGDSTDYATPKMQYPTLGYQLHSIFDYFGYPLGISAVNAAGLQTHSLFARAYNMIYRDWFRDQNIQDSPFISDADTADDPANYPLRRRGKRKDYVTSCLPWPQKGPSVQLPIGYSAPVYGTGMSLGLTDGYSHNYGLVDEEVSSGVRALRSTSSAYNQALPSMVGLAGSQVEGTAVGVVQSGQSGLHADLSTATASTINDIREAFQIQRFYEIMALNGSRYEEMLKAMWGVVSPDYRVMQPEYLGGSRHNITVNPVQQTSETTEAHNQGDLAAYSFVAGTNAGFSKSFTEHCVVLGICCVDADLTYQQNLERMHTLDTLFDFPFPVFENLGEEAVLRREVYASGSVQDTAVFGYQERYAWCKSRLSKITGKMRSDVSDSLDVFHLSEDFDTYQELNDNFIQSKPPLDRVLAIAGSEQPHMKVDFYHQYTVVRKLCARARTNRYSL